MKPFIEKLKEAGFKSTPQRLAIAQYIEGNRTHPTASRIYRDLKIDFPSMSMATIYNTLKTMTEVGLVHEYNIDKEQVHYDPDISQHHHFFCSRCKGVSDLSETSITFNLKNFEKKTKNRVTHVSVVLRGICRICNKISS